MELNYIIFFVDETDYLKSLLEQFDDPKKILNWRNQGQILTDYISLNEKVGICDPFDYKPELKVFLCSSFNKD